MSSAVITGNLITSSCVLTASSESSEFPLENLYDQVLAKIFQFGSAGAGWLQIDFGSEQSFDTIFIGNHNFGSGTTLTLKADNADPPTTVLAAPSYRALSIWRALGTVSARYLRIEHNDAGTPYVGELIVKTRTALPRAFRYGQVPGRRRADIYQETQAGVSYVYGLFERQARDYTWRVLEAELATFATLDEAVKGRLYPYVLIPDVSAAEVLYVRNVEGDFRPPELANKKAYDLMVRVQEESYGVLLSG